MSLSHPLDDRRGTGTWLRDNTPEAWTVAVGDCGMIPYYSGRPILDLYGILDRHIAGLRGRIHRKFDLPYFLVRNPEAVVLITRTPLTLDDALPPATGETAGGAEPSPGIRLDFGWNALADEVIYRSPEFHERYNLTHTIGGRDDVEGDPKFYNIYFRRDLAGDGG